MCKEGRWKCLIVVVVVVAVVVIIIIIYPNVIQQLDSLYTHMKQDNNNNNGIWQRNFYSSLCVYVCVCDHRDDDSIMVPEKNSSILFLVCGDPKAKSFFFHLTNVNDDDDDDYDYNIITHSHY